MLKFTKKPPKDAYNPLLTQRALTLLELLLCCVISFGLCVFLVSGVRNARKVAERRECADRMRQIGVAISLYALDHGQKFPKELNELYPEYIKNIEVFQCPEASSAVPADPQHGDYRYKAGYTSEDTDEILLSDRTGNHPGGGNLLTVKGEVTWDVPEKGGQWKAPL